MNFTDTMAREGRMAARTASVTNIKAENPLAISTVKNVYRKSSLARCPAPVGELG
jgi:hypothetical protein